MFLIAGNKNHATILYGFALTGLKNAIRALVFVQHHAVEAVWRRTGRSVSLLGDLHTPIENFFAEHAAVIRGLIAVNAFPKRVDKVVFLRKAVVCVNDLFAVLCAESLEVSGEVRILKAAPATNVEDEYVLKIVPSASPFPSSR